MPWYVAILIFDRCEDPPWINRDVRLIDAPDAESAYSKALEIGATLTPFKFVGLEDLQELRNPPPQHGMSVLYESFLGMPASEFVHPKEAMSVFWEERDWRVCRPYRHGRTRLPGD